MDPEVLSTLGTYMILRASNASTDTNSTQMAVSNSIGGRDEEEEERTTVV